MVYRIRRECDRIKRIYKYNLPETGGVLTLNIPPIYQIFNSYNFCFSIQTYHFLRSVFGLNAVTRYSHNAF